MAQPVGSEFLATTAQVIPALLIAYVVEQRFTEPSRETAGSVSVIVVAITLGLMTSGEFLALAGVAHGGSTWSARLIVIVLGLVITLMVGTFLIDYATVNLPDKDHIARHPYAAALGDSFAMLLALAATAAPFVAGVIFAIFVF